MCFIYINSIFLQIDLIGQSVYEFSHPCDHDEIREIISEKMTSDISDHTFFLRMKSTLTSKGRNINLKSATYKVRGAILRDRDLLWFSLVSSVAPFANMD